jgi:hypothetical protein
VQKSVEILSEELFYNSAYKPFRVLCISDSLSSSHNAAAPQPLSTSMNDEHAEITYPAERSFEWCARSLHLSWWWWW